LKVPLKLARLAPVDLHHINVRSIIVIAMCFEPYIRANRIEQVLKNGLDAAVHQLKEARTVALCVLCNK